MKRMKFFLFAVMAFAFAGTTVFASVNINSVTVGGQGGTPATYGTADNNITYNVTINYTTGGSSRTATPSIATLPTGVTAVFTPATITVVSGTSATTNFTVTLISTASSLLK
jgi:hypothetical protein